MKGVGGGETWLEKHSQFIRSGCGEKLAIVLVAGCASISKRKEMPANAEQGLEGVSPPFTACGHGLLTGKGLSGTLWCLTSLINAKFYYRRTSEFSIFCDRKSEQENDPWSGLQWCWGWGVVECLP